MDHNDCDASSRHALRARRRTGARIGARLRHGQVARDATMPVASSPPSSRSASQRDRLDGMRELELSDAQKRARVHFQIGHRLPATGPRARGIGELLSAERFDPMDAEIQFALAEAYRRQGRDAETEAHLLRVAPDSSRTTTRRAQPRRDLHPGRALRGGGRAAESAARGRRPSRRPGARSRISAGRSIGSVVSTTRTSISRWPSTIDPTTGPRA